MSEQQKAWSGDLLNREHEAQFLKAYLVKIAARSLRPHGRKSIIVNLKAPWGAGKSFFIANFAKQLTNDGHLVANWDAWQADPDVDPLVSLVAAIRNTVGQKAKLSHRTAETLRAVYKSGGSFLGTLAIGTAKRASQAALGQAAETIFDAVIDEMGQPKNFNPDEVSEELSDVVQKGSEGAVEQLSLSSYFLKQIKAVNAHTKAIAAFNSNLSGLVSALCAQKKYTQPMFVLVDELDRCSPTFTLKVLERINHLFDVEGLVFLISTDTEQLAHAINAVYGAKFDSRDYLNRFFSLTYTLNVASLEDIFEITSNELDFGFDRFVVLGNNPVKQKMKSVVCSLCTTPRSVQQTLQLIDVYSAISPPQILTDGILLAASAAAVYHGHTRLIDFEPIESSAPTNDFERRFENLRLNISLAGSAQPMPLRAYFDNFRQFRTRSLKILANIECADVVTSHINRLAMSQLSCSRVDPAKQRAHWTTYVKTLTTAHRYQ
mgnify:CR=1 FL=1|jgi:hypothetical protein